MKAKLLASLMVLFSSVFLSHYANAFPSRVIIIRHAEKPPNGPEVSALGCERAYQLPNFFKQYSDIAAIYAQQPKGTNSSIRALETITPTAIVNNLKINNTYQRDSYTDLVHEILADSNLDQKTVVISWEHSVIPSIAAALGVRLSTKLLQWPSSVFDQAWVISFESSSRSAHLDIVAEHVLPNDVESSQSGIENWGREVPSFDNGIVVPVSVVSECRLGNSKLNQKMNNNISVPLPDLSQQ